jgi:carbon starvation protein
MATKEKGYLVAWPIFGTSNQLLASLTLLVLSVWITKKTGKKAFYTLISMAFMLIITLWSLFMQIMPFLQILTGATQGTQLKSDVVISGICGIVLFILCLWLVIESVKILSAGRKDNKQISSGV